MGQGGADATEAFEEVGHSDEARQLLSGLELGSLIRQVNIPCEPMAFREADGIPGFLARRRKDIQ